MNSISLWIAGAWNMMDIAPVIPLFDKSGTAELWGKKL